MFTEKNLIKLILKSINKIIEKKLRINIFILLLNYKNKFYLKFTRQFIKIGNYKLQAPSNHYLFLTKGSQPLRDKFIEVTAKFVSEKYPNCTFIDIGANIGDTAARMANNCANKLILVEADDFYFELLEENSKQFINKIELKKLFIGNGEQISGQFNYNEGNAWFETKTINSKINTHLIKNICKDNVSLIKIDIEGFDIESIISSIEWIKKQKPAIIFEINSVSLSSNYLNEIDNFFDTLFKSNYERFIIWDDSGCKIISSKEKLQIMELCLYLRNNTINKDTRIYDLNVLALNTIDDDIFLKINNDFNKIF